MIDDLQDYVDKWLFRADEDMAVIDMKSLTDFGVSVRYPDDFYIPDLSEMIYYAQVAKQIREIVTGLIKSTR
jgi:hypothetical protein